VIESTARAGNPLRIRLSVELRMRLAACLMFALLPLAAGAADPVFEHPATVAQLNVLLGGTAQGLTRAVAVRGEFSQRKFLHELPQALNSSGDFLVARGVGIVWHTRVPFDSELVLTPTALVQRDAGVEAVRTDASSQPGLGAVEQIFDALFTLDLQSLDRQFALYGAGGEAGWTLGLKPREAAFGKVLTAVVVSGAAQPGRIVVFEDNSDRTEISLSGQTLLPALSDADRRRFK